MATELLAEAEREAKGTPTRRRRAPLEA